MRRQRTQPHRKLKTQVGTPTQRSPGGFGGTESGLRRSSALTFCRPFEAVEHVERRRWSNDGVEREAATTLASEAIYPYGPSLRSGFHPSLRSTKTRQSKSAQACHLEAP